MQKDANSKFFMTYYYYGGNSASHAVEGCTTMRNCYKHAIQKRDTEGKVVCETAFFLSSFRYTLNQIRFNMQQTSRIY